MTKERELLRRTLEVWDDDLILEDALALMKEIRTYLAVEEQYDALSERYAEGLGESMKACKESFEREAERAKELITAPSDDADEPGNGWQLREVYFEDGEPMMYREPHEWQGLDEDEVEEILEGFPMGTYSEQAFAQAIEQALKEKNT